MKFVIVDVTEDRGWKKSFILAQFWASSFSTKVAVGQGNIEQLALVAYTTRRRY
jgi:hypothetical protein